ncbi:hypothetical protein BWO99_03785 [Enterococcus faecalis ATCC 29212]|nr:hypothetical protein BWO99_03785 [Enterococcus faecalis ATCC 29212]
MLFFSTLPSRQSSKWVHVVLQSLKCYGSTANQFLSLRQKSKVFFVSGSYIFSTKMLLGTT